MHTFKQILFTVAVALCAACSSTPAPQVYSAAPLSPSSPWPKFRRDLVQDGVSPIKPQMTGGAFWSFQSGKGIFSNPVIAGDGTIYVGSADRYFYAVNPDGTPKWKLLTGEVIDSAALLDDKGRVYFGGGDGQLRALDAQTGKQVWAFTADDASKVNTQSTTPPLISWFEGNVGIEADGTLLGPNDNFYIYGLDRDMGTKKWTFTGPNIFWSLPAVDVASGNMFVGNNAFFQALGDNTLAFNSDGSKVLWSASALGTIAASPMLTKDGRVYLGGFDGYLRAYDQKSGKMLWSYGTRDHIYASPGLLPDGTIVQPSADGSVYDFNTDGTVKWEYDTREPIRSSPAIDGDGNIYLGTGEGRLLVLNPDGTLRWWMQLISQDRNDLNSSVSLGQNAVYLAGEDGELFSVPYDYCLRPSEASDMRCGLPAKLGAHGDLPADGVFVYYTTGFGSPLPTPPQTIDANDPLVFSLVVRQKSTTELSFIDSTSLKVTATPAVPLDVQISGDRHFFTVVPQTPFTADGSGNVTIQVTGQYLTGAMRSGLAFSGGTAAGSLATSFKFKLTAPTTPPALVVPAAAGQPTGAWEVRRMALPLPTVLPSYNQIGFDSLHYIVTLVEGSGTSYVAWFAGAKLAADSDTTVIDPATKSQFPLVVNYQNGQLTMSNDQGFVMNILNFDLMLKAFRISAQLDAKGQTIASPRVYANAPCGQIPTYGPFLRSLGFCNPDTDILDVAGAAELQPFGTSGTVSAPTGVGTVAFTSTASSVTATLTGSTLKQADHSFDILLIDAATGSPIALDYSHAGTAHAGTDGTVGSVGLTYPAGIPKNVRAYLIVDSYPAAKATLTLP